MCDDKNNSGKDKGFARGLTNYGDRGFSMYLRRSFASSMGYSRQMLDRPIVGIAHSASGFNNCHRHFPEMIEAVKRGVLAAGALPIEFPTISLGEVFLSPTSLKFRNLMSMDVEEMTRAQPMDSVVLLGGCDKTVPAQLMGAASAGLPSIQLVAGPMSTSRHRGERLGACTDCRRFWQRYRAGDVDDKGIDEVEKRLASTSGTCAVMGTASTMASLAEAIGMMPAGSAAIPAVDADRLRMAEETGRIAVSLIGTDKTPKKIITEKALENGVRILMAIGGSTNAIIHLAAIAGRLGLKIDLKRMNEISDTTPVLVDLKPTGIAYMEDLHAAGGIPAVMRELKHLLHLDCETITGETIGDRIEAADPWVDRNVVKPFDRPIRDNGGLLALFGNVAPRGAIIKRSAADPNLFERTGRAVVFTSLQDLAARIDDPDLDVTPDDFLVLQNAGPLSDAAMPEAGYIPIPTKLARAGVKDMVRISDARMSGTAYGTIVLHVAPDSASGGPIGLIRNGDAISLSVRDHSIRLLVSDEELEARRAEPTIEKTPALRGYDMLYRNHVLQADEGCDFDFLQSAQES
ncbi:dihydroxy-acid dehydratase [Ensifer adhaerens]|uniref:dihydroxy-acid dehydratase n=1 Tax=Ensifer adhaerens TaxID=106592 RepID=UPI001CBDF6DD|nr:dihydroxy-acid dehydratase [Ensifer adhaerens]MBZ7924842.1 dihydroxy-acid dehydratase [Ensifer adhaerens]UAX95940.1 dihydroxy-acid dehydratase [Ensifer adhaerens]UAY04718.1 dihydroxy-acid dehydratase [Ensifer adhaerens]UAY10149.1 dihydroxy-acid dehydratase [Ensifer adhaerens]